MYGYMVSVSLAHLLALERQGDARIGRLQER